MKVLYATKKGEPSYMEQIITTNESAFEPARKWAESQGFDRFRIATFVDGEKPDFVGAIAGLKKTKKKA